MRLRTSAAICALLVTGIVLAACIFQGMFFLAVPSAGQAVSYVAHQAGYLFNCYDLHGGWKCHFDPIPPTAEEVRQKRETAWNALQCHGDNDCVSTAKGGCALKGLFPALPEGVAKCVCVTGPVVFGCLPEAQARQIRTK